MNVKRLLRSIPLASLFLSLSLYSLGQTVPVSGKVTQGGGQPLNGVSIQVKGSGVFTTTKQDGTFSIVAPNAKSVLVFTYVGFETREIPVSGRTQIDISLQPGSNSLQDVVVVGYGSQKRSDVTGAVTSISAKTIEERPVTNALQAIQGKAAGVNVATNVKPGELPAVKIRGTRSINSSSEPLYVVDGIPLVSALGVTSASMNDINPNDIASIEILKDASATAIYGSRGSNGVILITTKKGTKGKVAFSYSGNVSLDSYKSLTDWMDAPQWIDRWRESLINGRTYQPSIPNNTNLNVAPKSWYPDPFRDNTLMSLAADPRAQKNVWGAYEWDVYGVTPKLRPTTAEEQAQGWPAQVPIYDSKKIESYDWLDAATRQGLTQNHQFAVSAGTDKARLYLSLGYNSQQGVQRDQNFNRFTVNMNGDINATKWLTLGVSMNGSISKQNYGVSVNSGNTGSKDLYSRSADQFTYAQPYDSLGAYIKNPGGNLNLWNPLIDIDQSINERRTNAILANIFTEVKFTSWLKYRLNFGAQVRNFRSGAWTGPNATGHLSARPNTAGYSRDENFSWVAENLLYFDKSFGKAHKLGATLLQSVQSSRRESINANVLGTVNPLSMWYDLAANTTGSPQGYGTGFTENTLASFMGRVNYTLLDKFLITATGRFDGASVLAPEHKWDFFPSFAAAWKMQEEQFISNISWIDELKPRVGYGVTGSSSVQPYTTSGPLSRNNYVFGSTAAVGFLPQLAKNPDLGWEQTAQWNIGLDFAFLRRRIMGSIEYYEASTSDLLYRRPLPAVTGYVEKILNIGKTSNKGFELTLTTVNIETKDFRWTTELNYATNKEEIVELLNGKEDLLANRLFIGQPIEVFYHYDNAGIWQNTKEDLDEMAKFKAAGGHNFYPGTIKVRDQNGDYKINADDYVIRGSARPKWTGGMTNTFSYKGWSLSSFIYARVGQMYFGGYPNSYGGTNPNGRVENDVWSFTNTAGKWPMPIMGATVDNFTPAMQYHSGTFFVVRNISLIYDVPFKLLEKASIKNLQLNVQVLNPFIFGGDIVKMGLNPDDETNWASQSLPNSNTTAPLGGTNNNTIQPQSIVFGLRIGF